MLSMDVHPKSAYHQGSLLIVEDNPADVTRYLRMLEEFEHGFDSVECVSKIPDALDIIKNKTPRCCILDNFLPDGSAIELISALRQERDDDYCPIIVVTGQEDTSTAVELMQKGVQDYLIKQDLSVEQLQRALHNAVKTWYLQTQIKHLALYDSLTGLVNRSLFIDRLSLIFEVGKRYQSPFSLAYLDLDHFKQINDQYGHEAGDFVLKKVADKLKSLVRSSDTVARLGGDEFAIILDHTNFEQATLIAEKLLTSLSMDLSWRGSHITVSPSLGISTYPSQARTYTDLMREADIALYRSKKIGRSVFSFYDSQLEEESKRIHELAIALPVAILNNHLQVAFQPILDSRTNQVVFVEALVRWNYKGSWVAPNIIVDLVLERRLSDVFHKWLFDACFTQLRQWDAYHESLKVSINLPANVCHDGKLMKILSSLTRKHNVAPSRVILEVTETYLMSSPETALSQLDAMSEAGYLIAIDDFGTGYSSMEYLANLPCSVLKIDQSFFLNLHKNARNVQIIQAIAALSHQLGIDVVAEGIENSYLSGVAKETGIDYIQGYYHGAPVFSEEHFAGYLESSRLAGTSKIA
jgi:diguanylate cyclase (GGDEF)-like protein